VWVVWRVRYGPVNSNWSPRKNEWSAAARTCRVRSPGSRGALSYPTWTSVSSLQKAATRWTSAARSGDLGLLLLSWSLCAACRQSCCPLGASGAWAGSWHGSLPRGCGHGFSASCSTSGGSSFRWPGPCAWTGVAAIFPAALQLQAGSSESAIGRRWGRCRVPVW
jgi:hypothetical protein